MDKNWLQKSYFIISFLNASVLICSIALASQCLFAIISTVYKILLAKEKTLKFFLLSCWIWRYY